MTALADTYSIVESRIVFEHAQVRVIMDTLEHNGRRSPYFYLEGPGEAVATIALTADGQIVLTRQYRHPVRAVIYDLPAGRLNPGESSIEGARRELEEETGYRAERIVPLGRYNQFPGALKVATTIFLATDLAPTRQRLDEGEELDVVLMPVREALAMILRGEVIDGSLQLGVLLAVQKGLIP